jgi:hypothetical protein
MGIMETILSAKKNANYNRIANFSEKSEDYGEKNDLRRNVCHCRINKKALGK